MEAALQSHAEHLGVGERLAFRQNRNRFASPGARIDQPEAPFTRMFGSSTLVGGGRAELGFVRRPAD